jgi:glyoxylase-like metal-dependent hydrolase (beta-lactamase superfamily II)
VLQVEEHEGFTFLRLARTVLGRPLYRGGAYYLNGTLVDCGPPATAREVLAFLEGRPLQSVLVTHHHEDHMGAAPLLHQRRGIVPLVHAAGVGLLGGGYPQELYRRAVWGRPRTVRAEPLPREVEAGDLRLQVLHTPGHSPDHVCFFEPERGWLFTGDLFLAERLRFLRKDEDFHALLASLEQVGALPVRRVLCAHRGVVPGGIQAVQRKAAHLRELRDRVRELLAQGLPEAEVARRAVGPEGWLTWASRGHFSARNFVRAVRRPAG